MANKQITLGTFKTAVSKLKLAQQHFYKVSIQGLGGKGSEHPNSPGLGGSLDERSMNNSEDFKPSKLTTTTNGGDSYDFDIWVQATKLPGATLTELELKKHNFTFRMPDHLEFDGSWTCDVLMDLSYSNYKKLLNWQSAYYNIQKDGAGLRGFPVATAKVSLLSNDFSNEIAYMNIYGLYPKVVPAIDLSQEASEYIKPTIEFGYSYTDLMMGNDPLKGA